MSSEFVLKGAESMPPDAVRAAETLLDVMITHSVEYTGEQHMIRQMALTTSIQALFTVASRRLKAEKMDPCDKAFSIQELFGSLGCAAGAVAWQSGHPAVVVDTIMDSMQKTLSGLARGMPKGT